MNRKILIITNPGLANSEHYCPGVYKDRENYIDYFKQPYGGLYSDSEIICINRPTISEFNEKLNIINSKEIEFSIVIFCGHGYYSKLSNSSILCLNETERIDSLDLRKNCNKRIIIEDSCREEKPYYLSESLVKGMSTVLLSDSKRKSINSFNCKYLYNKWISDCKNQIICISSCDIDETAGDDSKFGGYYSGSLLKNTIAFLENEISSYNSTKMEVFSVVICHSLSIEMVKKLSGGKQNPQIEKPRLPIGSKFLPFGVIA